MKVLKVISKLNKVDRNRLLRFIKSPYFNSNEELIAAYSFIDESLRLDRTISKEVIWQKVYKKRPYEDTTLRKLLSDMITLTEEFLAFEKLKENKLLKSILGYEKAKALEIEDLTKSMENKIAKSLDQFPLRNSDYFYVSNRFLKAKLDVSKYARSGELKQGIPEEIQRFIHNADVAYHADMLRIISKIQNLSYLTAVDVDMTMHDHVLDQANSDKIKDVPIIQLYLNAVQLYTPEMEEGIDEFVGTFFQYKDYLDQSEVKDLFEDYLNYYTIQINRGRSEYFKNLFDLYNEGLSSDLIINFTPTTYRNISMVAARVKQFEWALKFIEEYKEKLSPADRDSAYSFNKARVYGNMKDWDNVVETLRNVEYEDLTYNLNSKLILMIAYYELEEFLVLDSFMKSFKVFLRRRRNIPKARKEAFLGFTNVLSNIVKADDRMDKKRIVSAQQMLDENPSIPNKAWLREKIQKTTDSIGVAI